MTTFHKGIEQDNHFHSLHIAPKSYPLNQPMEWLQKSLTVHEKWGAISRVEAGDRASVGSTRLVASFGHHVFNHKFDYSIPKKIKNLHPVSADKSCYVKHLIEFSCSQKVWPEKMELPLSKVVDIEPEAKYTNSSILMTALKKPNDHHLLPHHLRIWALLTSCITHTAHFAGLHRTWVQQVCLLEYF